MTNSQLRDNLRFPVPVAAATVACLMLGTLGARQAPAQTAIQAGVESRGPVSPGA